MFWCLGLNLQSFECDCSLVFICELSLVHTSSLPYSLTPLLPHFMVMVSYGCIMVSYGSSWFHMAASWFHMAASWFHRAASWFHMVSDGCIMVSFLIRVNFYFPSKKNTEDLNGNEKSSVKRIFFVVCPSLQTVTGFRIYRPV